MISKVTKRQLTGLAFVICQLVISVALTSCNAGNQSAQQDNYRISGTISGLADGTVLVLTPVSHDREDDIAETIVSGGKFEFTGQQQEPIIVSLHVKDSWGGDTFILENADITVSAEAAETEENGAKLFKFSNFTVGGSPLTEKLNGYKARRDSLDVLYSDYHNRNKEAQEAMAKARMAQDQTAVDKVTATEGWKAFEADEHNFFQTVEKTFADIINENKDTYWGPMMAVYLYSYFTPEQGELFSSFSKEARESWYGQKMKDEIFPGGQPGTPAKQFTVKDDEGKEFTLKQLSEGKKVVLIDFWASWCSPCRKEIPNVKAQYAKYKDKGFQVISISTDNKEADWRKALAEEKLEWPNFRDTEGAAALYNVRAIPAMYLVDAETQTLIATGDDARGDALAAKLAELFK